LKLAMGALMLTFITAITAGFFIYQFMSDLTEKMKTAFPTQGLQVLPVSLNNTCITVSVENSASVNVLIIEVYVNGEKHNLAENNIIPPNDIVRIHLYGTYIKGETYTLKITPSLGSPLILDIKYD